MSRQLQAGFYSDVLLSVIKRDYKDLLVDAINSAKKNNLVIYLTGVLLIIFYV